MAPPDTKNIECWDDDEDFQCDKNFEFRDVSTTASIAGSSTRPSGHRDSLSSRRSWRSDRDSNIGDDEIWQLPLNDSDDSSNHDAIQSAKRAGIPLPSDIPKSALLGGTIKRLGGRRSKTIVGDDWGDDLDFSTLRGMPEVKLSQETSSSDALLNISALPTSTNSSILQPHSFVLRDLQKFRDTEDDDAFGEAPAIKVAEMQFMRNSQFDLETERSGNDHSFESALVLPEGDEPLRLSKRQDTLKSPDLNEIDFDTDWAEGSIGIRFGGTKREHSKRSSSIGAPSPSISSCLTLESEDDGLDGLILPDGPMDLQIHLQKRQQSEESFSTKNNVALDIPTSNRNGPGLNKKKHKSPADDVDFFSGIEIGNGEALDSRKLSLNRNVKRKVEQHPTPPRRGGTSITFTNKSSISTTRIPRLAHERPHTTQLEPVSESGAPVPQYRRPRSRLSGHAVHSSLSSIPLPSPTAATAPSSLTSPGRRVLRNKPSKEGPKIDLITTESQSLKTKRSNPLLRPLSGSMSTFQGHPSPSKHDGNSKTLSSSRPKTPIERTSIDSRYDSRHKPQIPFLPAGVSHRQSHHVSIKPNRPYRRAGSESSADVLLGAGQNPRMSKWNRSDTPTRIGYDISGDNALPATKKIITRPNRRKNFGDGTELDIFDDLPTSTAVESKYIKAPVRRGPPRSLRNKLSQSHISTHIRTDTPVPVAPISPQQDGTPRFARDTNASRNARDQRIPSISGSSKDREGYPLAPLSNTNWRTQAINRPLQSPTIARRRHSHKNSGSRPHLIKPMGAGVHEAKNVKGMQYNPTLYKWEGNENATAEFDPPTISTIPKPSLALISNVGGVSGAQIVGGMMFDPQRMCWVKASTSRPGSKHGTSATVGEDEEEEDVFAGLEDLDDRHEISNEGFSTRSSGVGAGDTTAMDQDDKSGDSSDEGPITEEFDVGPEFIRRQRAEEERWKRKVSKWTSEDRSKLDDNWRWAIRNIVGSFNITSPVPSN